MEFFALVCTIIIHSAFASDDNITSLFGTSIRKDMNFTELAKHDGYETVETHFVTTSDGYILRLFRLPLSENCTKNAKKEPILFMHGLYLSSDDCIVPGPKKAHCYIYADNCYDVWAPNVRGNVYSRNHTIYDPDKDSEFWEYHLDHLSLFDLPASIDYILDVTNSTQLSYVSHAQGFTMLLVLCAKKPEYNAKIKVGFGLSATAWLNNAGFFVVDVENALFPILTAANKAGVNLELLPRGGLTNTVAQVLCGLTTLTYPLCSILIFVMLGYNEYQITEAVLPVLVSHIPSGTSLQIFNHWGQMKKNGFAEFDYGETGNYEKYRQSTPPLYNLTEVSMKWIIFASENDNVATVKDLVTLKAHLPNATECILSDKTIGHLDFVFGKVVVNLTTSILSYLETGEFNCI